MRNAHLMKALSKHRLALNTDWSFVGDQARDGLGAGFLSTLRVSQAQLLLTDSFKSEPNYHFEFGLNIVDSRSSYAKEMAFDASYVGLREDKLTDQVRRETARRE
jgi:hypothetical protein